MTTSKLLEKYFVGSTTQRPEEGVDVAHHLEQLAKSFPVHEDGVLDQLCRKLSVAKRLSRHYAQGWKRASPAPLEDGHWNLLVVLLMAHAQWGLTAPDDRTRGQALKYWDAALKAADLKQVPPDIRDQLDGMP